MEEFKVFCPEADGCVFCNHLFFKHVGVVFFFFAKNMNKALISDEDDDTVGRMN